MTWVSRGTSGRVVIEIEPALKRELYAELIRDGRTLKQWFIERAEEFVREQQQPSLFRRERSGRRRGAR